MADNKKPSVPKLPKLNTSYECIASSFTAFNAHPHFAYSFPSHAASRICPHGLRYLQSLHQATYTVTDGRLNQQLDDIKAQMVIIDANTKSLIAEMKHKQPLHTDQKEATLGIDTIATQSTVKKMKMQAKMMKKYRKRAQQQEKVLAQHNEALGKQQVLFKQLQDVVEQQNVVIQEHKETLHEQSEALRRPLTSSGANATRLTTAVPRSRLNSVKGSKMCPIPCNPTSC
ncbi:hypothetical protein BC940DRAFT_318889 [Gongronella butleri]|nr:hypothetical protein BC940DRAFT_318889 [Gongronella butleri]